MKNFRQQVLLWMIALLAMVAAPFTVQAGQPYTSLGNMPSPTSAEFPAFTQSLIQSRLNECPIARPSTVYFSQSLGSDTAPGDGTRAHPYKTIGKLNTILHNSGGNIACLLMCGDEWYGSDCPNLVVDVNNATIGSYVGDNVQTGSIVAKPLLMFNGKKYAAGGGGWNAWGNSSYRTETSPIAWVRETADRLGDPYVMATDTTDVRTRNRSFYYDAGNSHLFINPGVGGSRDITTIGYDAAVYVAADGTNTGLPGTTANGISINKVDGTRIDGIRFEFGGINDLAHQGDHGYGLEFTWNGTKHAVISDCEGYYDGYHIIGTGQDANEPGGAILVIGCVTGFQRAAVTGGGAGGSDMVFFGDGCEALNINNELRYGPLPGTTGTGLGGHGSTGMTLYLEKNLFVPGGVGLNRHYSVGSFTQVPAANGDITKARYFILNRKEGTPTVPYESGALDTSLCALSVENTVNIGSYYNIHSTFNGGQAQISSTDAGNGWCINTTIILDQDGGIGYFTQNQAGKRQRFWNCHFVWKMTQAGIMGFDTVANGGTSPTDIEVKHSILQVAAAVAGWPIFVSINNNKNTDGSATAETLQDGNVYLGLRRFNTAVGDGGYLGVSDTGFRGAGNDPHLVTPSRPIPYDMTPPNDVALVLSGPPLTAFDARGYRRTTASCGPLVIPQATAVFANGAVGKPWIYPGN